MKTLNINIILLLCLLCNTMYANGGEFGHEKTKKINKEFVLNANEKLTITNRFGHVNVKPWDENKAKIDVTIIVDTKSDKKSQELLDRITVEFEESAGELSATTMIETEKSSWIQIVNVKYEINYNIMMPRKAYLDLTNKYGSAEVGALDNDISASIKYGNIDFDAQKGDVSLYLGYGSAKLPSASNLRAEVKYSDMEVGDVNDVVMDSKYSQFVFGQVNTMNVESGYDSYKIAKVGSFKNDGKYDDWKIENVGSLRMDTKYTDVKIGILREEGFFDQKYGGIKISEVSNTVTQMNFSLAYVNVTLQKINTGYNVNFVGSRSDIECDSEFTVDSKNLEGTDLRLQGQKGNGQVKMDVEMKYGNFRIL